MQSRLKQNRREIEQTLGQRKDRRFFSPAFLAQHRAVEPALRLHARGRVIDLGCGDAPFRGLMPPAVTEYDTLDFTPRSANITYVADVQDMRIVPSGTYDTALCFETLEHIPNPAAAVREIYRVLAPGGTAIVTVPHLSRLHDEPHDYYRFTVYGLRYLFSHAGFTDLEIEAKGGLFAFLGHQLSTIFMTLLWAVRGLRGIAWTVNKWLITLPMTFADRLLHGTATTPLGYIVIAHKPATPASKAAEA